MTVVAAPVERPEALGGTREGLSRGVLGGEAYMVHAHPLVAAIVEGNRTLVQTLLAREPEIGSREFRSARLYRSGIFHWIYEGDT